MELCSHQTNSLGFGIHFSTDLSVTYKEPKLLFDNTDSGLYWDAFGDEGNRVTTWTEPQLDEATVSIALDFYFKDLGRRLKKAAKEAEEQGGSSSDQEGWATVIRRS